MDHSVTMFIEQLRDGNPDAAAGVWEHFHSRLIQLARGKLRSRVRRVVDEEDVVISAFDSCFRAIQDGRFPDLKDRYNLWAVLVTITERKAFNVNRDQTRQKRGGGEVLGESVFLNNQRDNAIGLGGVVSTSEPTPEFAALVADECEKLLGLLDDEQRRIAQLKLEGFKNREIAEDLDCSIAKVERKLKMIREVWSTDE